MSDDATMSDLRDTYAAPDEWPGDWVKYQARREAEFDRVIARHDRAVLEAALDVEELTEVLARHQWNMLPLVVAREMSPWDDDRVSRSALAQTFRDRARPFAEAVRRSIVGA